MMIASERRAELRQLLCHQQSVDRMVAFRAPADHNDVFDEEAAVNQRKERATNIDTILRQETIDSVINSIESQTAFCLDLLKWASVGEYDHKDKARDLDDAENALKKFFRCFYGTTMIERRAAFSTKWMPLVIADMPELPEVASSMLLDDEARRAEFRIRLIDYQLAEQLERLSSLISKIREDIGGTGFQASRHAAETAALDRLINTGCWAWQMVHGRIPLPQKKGTDPAGPFSRFMAAALAPVVEKLRQNGEVSYGWPTLLKRIENIRAKLLAPQTA